MNKLMTIAFAGDMPAVAVEVVAPDLAPVANVFLGGGGKKTVAVAAEDSFIRLHLSSGKIVTIRHPGTLHYEVSRRDLAERAPAEDRPQGKSIGGWPAFGKPGRMIVDPESLLGDLSAKGDFDALRDVFPQKLAAMGEIPGDTPTELAGGVTVACDRTMWGRLARGGARLTLQPPPIAFDRRRGIRLNLQVEGGAYAVELPGNLERLQVDAAETQPIRILVTTGSTIADTIGGYLLRGNYDAAASMADWIAAAEQMLWEKLDDPFAAAAGAYLLLRVERFDLMRDWPRNLAERFEGISDGAIIWAWQNILERRDYAEAERYLLRSAQGGLPTYTEGMRLLADGLARLGDRGREALDGLSARTGRVLWNSPFTTCVKGPVAAQGTPREVRVDYLAR